MAATYFTEQALRAAVNSSSTADKTGQGNQADDIKTAALKRITELVSGNSTVSSIGSELNLQSMAISAAIQGIQLSFQAIQAQLDNLNDKRLSFDKEREAGIATFEIPTNKEESDFSKQERVIRAFMQIAERNPFFSSYLGIKKSVSNELGKMEFYSVLPYYKMSQALLQPEGSSKEIDRQRIAISLFFKSPLPDAIADIDTEFQTEIKFFEFFKSAFKKENYLKDLRAPRFIMMSLANLLWNLQHPTDPVTGYPLSVERNIELCRAVGLFLNRLLNHTEKTCIKELSNSSNNLLSFVRKVERHVRSLRKGFIDERLHELNINDLTNSAHHCLRIMDKSIFELIYTRKNPLNKQEQPDSKAAEELAYTVDDIGKLLTETPEFINYFRPLANKTIPFVNTPPQTIMDALILFVHSTSNEKDKLYEELGRKKSDEITDFIETLYKFDNKFVRPLKEITKKELNVGLVFNKKRKKVARDVARRLIPLITLVLEDYRVEVEIPIPLSLQKATDTKYTSKEQINAINAMANKKKGYYIWELSPFVELNKETEDVLDQLPLHQYRFSEITKLLDGVKEIVHNYRSFLQYKTFQQFLIKCLNNVKAEYNKLGCHIEQLDTCLSKDKSINRGMQSVLEPMNNQLANGLESFSNSFAIFEQVISNPDFTEQQKNSLANKLGTIHNQFITLFGEDSGILSFITPPSSTTHSEMEAEPHVNAVEKIPSEPYEPVIKPKQINELSKLIIRCINALSYHSRLGEKGRLLNNLLKLTEDNGPLTPNHLEQIVKELAKITLSYRPTFFYQANYGETRSSKELIASIKNTELNRIIPIAELLLGADVDPNKETNEEIVRRLKGVRVVNKWEESASEIKSMLVLGSV